MLKCVVQNCQDTCYPQCFKRCTPQRAEAIKNLNIVHNSVGNVCAKCGKGFIEGRHQGKTIKICGCRIA
jgi:hypothetical protein